MRRAAMLAVVATSLAASAPAAHANSKADALFEKGKKALAQKQYADACQAFEQSDKLDPGIGVKLNAARCYEAWGKLARAYTWYADAQAMAAAQQDRRLPQIAELIETLDADVPKLTIVVPADSDLAGSQLKLDGRPLPTAMIGKETRVDPGPHELTWQVGGTRKSRTLALERGASREVQLALAVAAPAGEVTVADAQAGASVGKTRKLVAVVLVGAGAVALGASGYLTLSARSDYNDALDAHCMSMTTACTAEGLERTGDARSRANLATAVAIGGVAVAAAGVILYLTAPTGDRRSPETSAAYVTPTVGAAGAGFVVGGHF